MYTIYRRWDATRFPWLIPNDNEWKKEQSFVTHQLALEYIYKHGTNAYEYKIEPDNSNCSCGNS